MKHVSYLEYVITVTTNNEKGMWRPHMIITWYAGKFGLHDDVTFTTEAEAEEHGIEVGKHWVNNRLQSMQGWDLKAKQQLRWTAIDGGSATNTVAIVGSCAVIALLAG